MHVCSVYICVCTECIVICVWHVHVVEPGKNWPCPQDWHCWILKHFSASRWERNCWMLCVTQCPTGGQESAVHIHSLCFMTFPPFLAAAPTFRNLASLSCKMVNCQDQMRWIRNMRGFAGGRHEVLFPDWGRMRNIPQCSAWRPAQNCPLTVLWNWRTGKQGWMLLNFLCTHRLFQVSIPQEAYLSAPFCKLCVFICACVYTCWHMCVTTWRSGQP